MGLRLGAPTCGPHQCRHCSVEVDVFGRHSLSCKKSEGRHFRHSALNDIVKRGLSAAHIPSRLEPTGLLRSDGKRPDGVTLAPWSSGCLLVWDAQIPLPSPTGLRRPHRRGEWLRVPRTGRQRSTVVSHSFTTVAIETLGAIGPRSMLFLRDLGRRIALESGEPRSTDYLLQRLSVA